VHGELAGLGIKVAASTVWEILRTSGIDPAPRRTGATWSQFLRSQAEAILACDCFTADLLDGTQAYVLLVIGYATRHNQHRPHRSLHNAAPLKPLPGPVNLDLYRIRRRAHPGGMINGYRLVA
jgi:hypothetical protein